MYLQGNHCKKKKKSQEKEKPYICVYNLLAVLLAVAYKNILSLVKLTI